jgi:hypothetical protein
MLAFQRPVTLRIEIEPARGIQQVQLIEGFQHFTI